MKIVILDGAVVNPGDLSWEALEEMGRLTVYDRTPPEEVVGRAKDAEIVLTNKVYFTGELMEQCPRLKYIGALATGYNNIDVAAAARLGIAVTNVPAYSTPRGRPVYDGAPAGALPPGGAARRRGAGGKMGQSARFLLLGNAPAGALGQAVRCLRDGADRAGSRGAGPRLRDGGALLLPAGKGAPLPRARRCGMEELLAEADILSLHCPLTEDTFHLMEREKLGKMKDGAILLNTARGPLVDERAVAAAAQKREARRIRGGCERNRTDGGGFAAAGSAELHRHPAHRLGFERGQRAA